MEAKTSFIHSLIHCSLQKYLLVKYYVKVPQQCWDIATNKKTDDPCPLEVIVPLPVVVV